MVARVKLIDGKTAIVLDDEAARRLGLGDGDEVHAEVENGRLIVSPASDGIGSEEVARHLSRVENEFGEALRKLGE